MKVLQVNCVYKRGSTGKIVADIHNGIQLYGIESVVCYGRGDSVYEQNVYKTCSEWYSKLNNIISRFTGIMYGGCYFSTNRLITIIKKEKPDIVHLHCINGYFVNIYRIINWLKNHKIRTVLSLHAEFMYTGGCGHAMECEQWRSQQGCGKTRNCPQWKTTTKSLFMDRTSVMWNRMKKAFEGFENLTVTSVSPWVRERAMQSPILRNKKNVVVLNGLDTTVFKRYEVGDLVDKLGHTGKKIIFHATPFFTDDRQHIKGGYYIIELAKKLSECQFVVAGPYREGIMVPDNIILLGRLSDQIELARWYSLADITVIASKRETFSMIVAESLSCGTPVAGFKAGAPEMISIPEYSRFVEYGDVDALKEAVAELIMASIDHDMVSKAAHEIYSAKQMYENYMRLYKEVVK